MFNRHKLNTLVFLWRCTLVYAVSKSTSIVHPLIHKRALIHSPVSQTRGSSKGHFSRLLQLQSHLSLFITNPYLLVVIWIPCSSPRVAFPFFIRSHCVGVPAHSRVSSKIQQLLNTLKRPKRPPLREFFVDDFEELLDGKKKILHCFKIRSITNACAPALLLWENRSIKSLEIIAFLS